MDVVTFFVVFMYLQSNKWSKSRIEIKQWERERETVNAWIFNGFFFFIYNIQACNVPNLLEFDVWLLYLTIDYTQ